MKRIVKRNPVTTYAKLLSCGGRFDPDSGRNGAAWGSCGSRGGPHHTPRVFQRDMSENHQAKTCLPGRSCIASNSHAFPQQLGQVVAQILRIVVFGRRLIRRPVRVCQILISHFLVGPGVVSIACPMVWGVGWGGTKNVHVRLCNTWHATLCYVRIHLRNIRGGVGLGWGGANNVHVALRNTWHATHGNSAVNAMRYRYKWAYSCMWRHNAKTFCGADVEKELADAAADLTT